MHDWSEVAAFYCRRILELTHLLALKYLNVALFGYQMTYTFYWRSMCNWQRRVCNVGGCGFVSHLETNDYTTCKHLFRVFWVFFIYKKNSIHVIKCIIMFYSYLFQIMKSAYSIFALIRKFQEWTVPISDTVVYKYLFLCIKRTSFE